MLWEESGALWSANQIRRNSSIKLFSYDLSRESGQLWFDSHQGEILDAIIQEPWAPAGAPQLANP